MKHKKKLLFLLGCIGAVCAGTIAGLYTVSAVGGWEVPMSGEFSIQIPATITANSNQDIQYSVEVTGELHPYDIVVVKPPETLTFTKDNDSSQQLTVSVTQDEYEFNVVDSTDGYTEEQTNAFALQEFKVSQSGTVNISECEFSAGSWNALIAFEFDYMNNSQADYFPDFNVENFLI